MLLSRKSKFSTVWHTLLIVFLLVVYCSPVYADNNSPVTFDFSQGKDLKTAITWCAKIAGVPVFIDPGVIGNVSINLQAVPFNEAIQRIAAITGIVYEWKGVSLYVHPPQVAVLIQSPSTPANTDTSSQPATTTPTNNTPPPSTTTATATTAGNQSSGLNSYIGAGPRLFKLKYVKSDNAKGLLTAVFTEDRIKSEPITNSLLINCTDEEYERIKPIIDQLDAPPKQVLFEAQIIELTNSSSEQFGVNWEWLPYPGPTPIAGSPRQDYVGTIRIGKNYDFNYQGTLNALISNDKARVLAKPRITALDGDTARINILDKLPVESKSISNGVVTTTVDYKEVGITLEVTPRANDDDYITILVRPEVSTNVAPSGSNPTIRTRQAVTSIRVKTGETIIIGGLLQTETRKKVQKFPILGDIPLAGNLFKSTTSEQAETDLVIFITPRLIGSSGSTP
jgi:type II secretory pathway component GspD/PulD (secretin)